MRIGNLTISLPVGLSPMAGVTDVVYRLIAHEYGAGWSVSEMISAKGCVCAPENARAVRDLSRRSRHEGISGIQIFGHEPFYVAEAARRLSDAGFAFVDINMGCPALKITSNGEGSALMKEPQLAGEIVKSVKKAVRMPVTAKIRAGWDENNVNAVEVARILADNGVDAITVHGRTRMQFYGGHSDNAIIRAVREAVDIPVIGNGDVDSGEAALKMIRETGCDGVMVGRAAQGNPWIFREVASALSGEAYEPPCFHDRINAALRHLDMMIAIYGDRTAVLEMRKHFACYLQGVRGCSQMRGRINTLESADELRSALLGFLSETESIN